MSSSELSCSAGSQVLVRVFAIVFPTPIVCWNLPGRGRATLSLGIINQDDAGRVTIAATRGLSCMEVRCAGSEGSTIMADLSITLYGTLWCSDCKRTKKFFGEQRVHYDFVNIED